MKKLILLFSSPYTIALEIYDIWPSKMKNTFYEGNSSRSKVAHRVKSKTNSLFCFVNNSCIRYTSYLLPKEEALCWQKRVMATERGHIRLLFLALLYNARIVLECCDSYILNFNSLSSRFLNFRPFQII